MSNFNQKVNSALKFLDNQSASNAITLLAILYGSLAAPQLPYQIAQLFNYAIFRFIVLFLIVWNNTKNPTQSINISLGILVVFYFISYFEGFRIDQDTDIHPGCLGLTMADVLNVFNGDEEALHMALFNSGVPKNIPLNDEFAPLIASFLINKGYDFGESCNLNNNKYLNP